MILSLALAAELGAAAPSFLKDCGLPVIERQAGPTDPNYAWLRHIRRLPEATCEPGGGLLSSFAERSEPAEFTPMATEPSTPIAAAQTPEAAPQEPDEAMPLTPFGSSGSAPFTYGGPIYTPVVFVPAVPEPRIGALILLGLGAIGWIKGRSKA